MPNKIFNQELVTIFAAHLKLFIVVPILAALIVYALGSLGPNRYISTAYLKIDKATANAAGPVMSAHGGDFRLSDTDPQVTGPHLYRLDVEHGTPQEAQKAAGSLIENWLKATKPGPSEQAMLQLKLEKAKGAAAANAALVDQLKDEAKTLVQQQGELATAISNLMSQRDYYQTEAAEIERKLGGLPNDVVIRAPSLPAGPAAKGETGKAVLAGFASIPLLLAILLLIRFYRGTYPPMLGQKAA